MFVLFSILCDFFFFINIFLIFNRETNRHLIRFHILYQYVVSRTGLSCTNYCVSIVSLLIEWCVQRPIFSSKLNVMLDWCVAHKMPTILDTNYKLTHNYWYICTWVYNVENKKHQFLSRRKLLRKHFQSSISCRITEFVNKQKSILRAFAIHVLNQNETKKEKRNFLKCIRPKLSWFEHK